MLSQTQSLKTAKKDEKKINSDRQNKDRAREETDLVWAINVDTKECCTDFWGEKHFPRSCYYYLEAITVVIILIAFITKYIRRSFSKTNSENINQNYSYVIPTTRF